MYLDARRAGRIHAEWRDRSRAKFRENWFSLAIGQCETDRWLLATASIPPSP
jgi:hypothetical protein